MSFKSKGSIFNYCHAVSHRSLVPEAEQSVGETWVDGVLITSAVTGKIDVLQARNEVAAA